MMNFSLRFSHVQQFCWIIVVIFRIDNNLFIFLSFINNYETYIIILTYIIISIEKIKYIKNR